MRLWPITKVRPKTIGVTGYGHYLIPLRKLVFDYDPLGPTQEGMRRYLTDRFVQMAKENPEVEFVVCAQRRGTPALLRGHYINGKEKVVCVSRRDLKEVSDKVDVLLNRSGVKLKSLKNLQLEAAPGGESARGIWSALHDQAKPGGGYVI